MWSIASHVIINAISCPAANVTLKAAEVADDHKARGEGIQHLGFYLDNVEKTIMGEPCSKYLDM